MLKYFAFRVLALFGTLFGVIFLTFVISRILPGSPVEILLGGKPTPEQIAQKKIELGLDKDIATQFYLYVSKLFRGDLGDSLMTGRPVVEDLALRIPITLELVTLATLISLVIGIPMGVLAAVRNNRLTDNFIRLFSVAGIAAPVFFLAVMMQIIFYSMLRWFPLQGRIDTEIELDHPFDEITGFYLIDPLLQGNVVAWGDAAMHLVLPILTLVIGTAPIFVRVTRNMVMETLRTDHFRTMLAYRVPAYKLYGRYAVRSAFIPVLTFAGLVYGYLIGNSVFVEFIFDLNGLGAYVVNALLANDFNAVMGVTLVLAFVYLVVNLFIDMTYFALDPRLRR